MPLQVGLRRAALLGDTQRVSRVMMWARTLPAEHTDSGCSVGSTALGSASLFCVSHSGGFGWITFVTELINFHLDLSNGFYFVFVSSLVPLSFLLTLEAKKPPKTTNQTNKQKKKHNSRHAILPCEILQCFSLIIKSQSLTWSPWFLPCTHLSMPLLTINSSNTFQVNSFNKYFIGPH